MSSSNFDLVPNDIRSFHLLPRLDLPVGVQVPQTQVTAAANVVVTAGQNGPMMRQRGIVAHQAHRVGVRLGSVVVFLHRDGGGRFGLGWRSRGVGGIFVLLGVVPNYRGSGTPASAATAAAAAATAVSSSATAGHASLSQQQVVGRLLAARFCCFMAASFLSAALDAHFLLFPSLSFK